MTAPCTRIVLMNGNWQQVWTTASAVNQGCGYYIIWPYAVADKERFPAQPRLSLWSLSFLRFLTILNGGGESGIMQCSLTYSHILRDSWKETECGKVNMMMSTSPCLLSGNVTSRRQDTAAIWQHVYWSVAIRVLWLTPSHQQPRCTQCRVIPRLLQHHQPPRHHQRTSQNATQFTDHIHTTV